MKSWLPFAALTLICCPLFSHAATTREPLALAVFDIETADPALKTQAGNLTAVFSTFLSAEKSLVLVERQQLEAVLGEQALGASGAVNAQSAAKVGQLTGAKVILLSRMFAQGKNLTLVTKAIGTETGRVVADVATLPPGDKQAEALKVFADKVAEAICKKSDELVAKPEAADEHIARLTKLLEGRKLPTISVHIPEQHITHRVIDPAAETEIAKALGQLGFTLLQPSATPAPAFEVTGEAFSEQALQRGDFISCRARVEIKVIEAATGKILLQDRQVEVAVDLSEAVAAKTALQKAGLQLADRIATQFATLK